MSGSSFGKLFKITTWGESHGKAIGVVIDGCPSGLSLCEEDIQIFLDRRKPGQNEFTTLRNEDDKVEILSGVFEGKTTGTPISLIVYNKDHHSTDYGNIASCYRPGHADYTFDQKYGFRDYRGGGRSSGRETIGRVAAGAVAIKILKELGISFTSYVSSIGELFIDYDNFSEQEIYNNPFYMPDGECAKKAEEYLKDMTKPHLKLGERFGYMNYGYLWYKPFDDREVHAAIGDSGNIIYVNKEANVSVGVTGTFKPRIFDRVDFIERRVLPVAKGIEK